MLAAGVAVATPAWAATLTITTEDYPPFNLKQDGQLTGISTEIVRKALDLTKIDATIDLYPWARAYESALKDPTGCVYSTSRTAERETLFKWVGPIAKNEWVLFGRADSPKLASLDDAKGHTIGGYPEDATTKFMRDKGLKVEEAATDRLNAKKLQAGRIEYWGDGKLVGLYIARQEGVTGLVPELTMSETSMFLACNKGVPDDIIEKLNAAIKQMNDDGSTATIYKKYE